MGQRGDQQPDPARQDRGQAVGSPRRAEVAGECGGGCLIVLFMCAWPRLSLWRQSVPLPAICARRSPTRGRVLLFAFRRSEKKKKKKKKTAFRRTVLERYSTFPCHRNRDIEIETLVCSP